MRFEDVESRQIARTLYGVDTVAAMDEVFLKGQGDYVNRARNWKRSHATKHAWRKHRHHFMRGIRHALRRNQGKLLRGSLVDDIKKSIREGKAKDTVRLEMHEHFKYEFLRKLSLLESLLFKSSTYFMLEDAYVDASLLAEEASKSMILVKFGILDGGDIPKEAVEMVLSVCGEDLVSESICRLIGEEESLVECLQGSLK